MKEYQFRDCQAWREDGVPLSTTSNEAAKLFDSAIHQYIGYYDNPRTGGLKGALASLAQIDPEFVMGEILSLGVDLVVTNKSLKLLTEVTTKLDKLEEKCEKSKTISGWEKRHIKALKQWVNGRFIQATEMWQDILVDFPRDILATKLAHDTYFYLGNCYHLRDNLARVMPYYQSKSSPYYGYTRSLYAFGLEETNLYRDAERYSLEALEFDKNDAWASHALSHVLDMEGRHRENEIFLSSTKNDWTVCEKAAGHVYWHWCLSLVDQGRFDDALDVFDGAMSDNVYSSGTMLNIVDSASLLFRLQLEGVNVGERWQDIHEICRPYLDTHAWVFNDLHILMSMCGLKRWDLIEQHRKSFLEHMENSTDDFSTFYRLVGSNIYEGIKAYTCGDYETAIEYLVPARRNLMNVGGSFTQRDLFDQILITCALQSPNKQRLNLARSLIYERKACKPNAPLTERLMSKLFSVHVANGH